MTQPRGVMRLKAARNRYKHHIIPYEISHPVSLLLRMVTIILDYVFIQ